MRNFVILALIAIISFPSLTRAEINLDGPLAPPDGAGMQLPENPTELLDKAVNSLPQSEEELKAVGSKIKESLGTETGQRVRAVLKDIGKAFVWATELMVRGIKFLIDKL